MWEPHTVLVEMFTQSDCAPCVFVEEALERLMHDGEKFELITYALDDEISLTTAQARGVTSTPHVFIDYGIQEIVGGEDTDSSMEELSEAVAEAARRDTPPAMIDFNTNMINMDSNITAKLSLPGTARDPISGTFTIYRIEEYSNLRNHQGIPMKDRFIGEIDRDFVDNLKPGEWLNITVDDLAPGEGIVAVFYGDDGDVLQSSSYKTHMNPGVYLAKASTWLKIDTPGSDVFNLTIDHFEFQESHFDPVDFEVSLDKEIPGIDVWGPGGQTIDMNWTTFSFEKIDTDMFTTPAGRIRYYANFAFDLDIPGNLSGTYSFKIRVRAGPKLYANTIAVTATPIDDNTSVPLEVHDYNLIGEGQNIFLVANISGVPDGASVHGRILPCLDDSGICGVPVEIVLVEVDGSPGFYRQSVVGIDIDQYTHFTYYVWVEDQGVELTRTQEVKVEIASIIEIEDDGGDGDDDVNIFWLLIGPAAILLLIIIVVILVLLSRRKAPGESEEAAEEPTPYTEETALSDTEEEITGGEVETGIEPPSEQGQPEERVETPAVEAPAESEAVPEPQIPVEPSPEPPAPVVEDGTEPQTPVQQQASAPDEVQSQTEPAELAAPPEPPQP
jgi:glutaredoxin